ncbi:hypothetical protein SpCBS45565_g01200 [Spizellomyces sp. 'palustris']|nr:hypothetical protein SpCBS45565_g01200 [Spizellomyces sp. 'palustris']
MSTDGHYDNIKNYYGKVLSSTKDLKTSACCAAEKPHPIVRQHLLKIPDAVLSRFYGCGNPVPLGIEGLSVLDLGCGTGRDCYLAAGLVGPKGAVIGVDMTEEQLKVARDSLPQFEQNIGYKPNMRFVQGFIEALDDIIAPSSIDVCISNCVINLSPDKEAVLRGVYNALKPGGEFYFSDVYADRRISAHIQSHKVLQGECLAGALYIQDFLRLCHKIGFTEPRCLSTSTIDVTDPALSDICGNIKFYSITYRLFKLPELESICEDYGQVATYLGTIQGHKHYYDLDDHHRFVTGKPMLVCGNTADMVGQSWLKRHFKVVGDRSVHFGVFECGTGKGNDNCAAGPCC